MVVAVLAVRTVQAALDEIVHMIAVGYGLVTAAGAVLVADLVRPARLTRRATIGVLVIDRDPVLIDVIPVGMVEMPVVEIVGMSVVADGEMAAFRTVLVSVVGVDGVIVFGHQRSFGRIGGSRYSPLRGLSYLPGTRTILTIAK